MEEMSKLSIFNIEPTDSATYACVASNFMGAVETKAHLLIEGQKIFEESCLGSEEPELIELVPQIYQFPKEKPRFLENLKDVRTTAGEKVELVAKVTGSPMPKIAWYRNNVQIDVNDTR